MASHLLPLLKQPRIYLALIGALIILAVSVMWLTRGTPLDSSPTAEAVPPTSAPGLRIPAANAAPDSALPETTAGEAAEGAPEETEDTAPPEAPPAPAAKPPPPPGTVLLDDDFNGLDGGTWRVADHAADVNQELQYYSPANVAAAGGTLRLSAEEREAGGRQYASGMVTTAGKFAFTYGTVEWRARPVKGQGMWQALWLHGNDCAATIQSGSQLCPSWPTPGSEEIDVLEYRGGLPQQVHMAFHHNTEPGRTAGMDCQYNGPDLSADWHTYALEWSPGVLVWKVDGVERCRGTEHVPDTPMYLVMNLAVGGFWAGAPNANTVFPQSFQIDWVRVTQPDIPDPAPPADEPEPEPPAGEQEEAPDGEAEPPAAEDDDPADDGATPDGGHDDEPHDGGDQADDEQQPDHAEDVHDGGDHAEEHPA